MPSDDQEKRVAPAQQGDATSPTNLPPARVRVRRPSPSQPVPAESSTAVAASKPPTSQAEPSPQADYEIGYGKPPKHTRFKPGNNANPKGRPKQSRSFWVMFDEEMNTPVTARIDGRTVKMTARVAAVKRLVAKVVSGDMKALELWIKYEQLKARPADQPQEEPLTEKEAAALEAFYNRITGGTDDDGGAQ